MSQIVVQVNKDPTLSRPIRIVIPMNDGETVAVELSWSVAAGLGDALVDAVKDGPWSADFQDVAGNG